MKRPLFLEREMEIRDYWDKNEVFKKLVNKNRGGPRYSFIDGPITANNPMGVHHAWGRTLKDLAQRLRAMQGYELRYQNGFDCQGLWVEVEVEKDLGFKSKVDIESLGLDRFSKLCRNRVEKFSKVQLEQSIRLGQWQDWGNNYFTMSNVNIQYVWHFLKVCQGRGLLTSDLKPMPWCTRCGTSLSQHEVSEGYRRVEHDAVYLFFPFLDVPEECLMVWTTTPWTLLANVAAAVHPDFNYAKLKLGNKIVYLLESRSNVLGTDFIKLKSIKGAQLVGRPYRGPFDDLESNKSLDHRVVPWGDVSDEEGVGVVHIAPGCGLEDYELGQELNLPTPVPIDEAGIIIDGYGEFTGQKASEAYRNIFEYLQSKELLFKVERYSHSYPHCWRDGSELLFRLVSEWFINTDADYGDSLTLREHLLKANAKINWIPSFYGTRMADWLSNMQNWCISRKRYWGMPLPFYTNDDGSVLHVIGSTEELKRLVIEEDKEKAFQLVDLHRPWIDQIRIRDPQSGETLKRIPEVGDCWLDAGIVPFSTLGYKDLVSEARFRNEQDDLNRSNSAVMNPENADFSHQYWKKWFPADLIGEMRAQIQGWFYAMLFMSVVLEDRSPYLSVFCHEEVRDKDGEEMHKSAGNAIWLDDALDRAGADPLRWLYCGQNPALYLRFGWEAIQESTKELIGLWSVVNFYCLYTEVDKFYLRPEIMDHKPIEPLDRWIVSRRENLIRVVRNALEEMRTYVAIRAVKEFVDDLSNWYIRRNRRRFWKIDPKSKEKLEGYYTLGATLIRLSELIAPILPHLAEQIFLRICGEPPSHGWPPSVHLRDYPNADESLINLELEETVAQLRKIIAAGLSLRNAAKMRVRQPLAQAILFISENERERISIFKDAIQDELNVKDILFSDSLDPYETISVRPNFDSLKKRFTKKEMASVISEIQNSDPQELLESARRGKGRFIDDDLLVIRKGIEDYAVHRETDYGVALNLELNDKLRQEGIVRDIVRKLQVQRRNIGLAVEQQIELHIDAPTEIEMALKDHHKYIIDELLVVEFSLGHREDISIEPVIVKTTEGYEAKVYLNPVDRIIK